ncbi:heme-binding protein 2-like isoform X5 [Dreissena polymorpha]|uniref:Uncharacterized protein n=2 Tax=Dreissena polymorpha TaxID=45954 RepID=A0A9D4REU1_DREPO|nr:heme-binding protein 2-like isoform X5 [Dreissena polymorpha]XP_052263275.1 heme-binding protein 2-like isoform X5 [Dreissena polymorpha]XP_052263276.1 heme-binding protein 2-like isoform X5 [Dreissena polymorpha]XP_052263277.1 heme-binding protein 2-like isoform X5 [Dreissena polymorpha]KAH3863685.1 hypothetical protein DPMN_026675 [Dreissena polymorpha]
MVKLHDLNLAMETLLPGMLRTLTPRVGVQTNKPSDQTTLKQPLNYTVVSKTETYEERLYPRSTWLCTTVQSLYQDTARVEGFRHLQAYTQGDNSVGAQLVMKPPILTRISAEGGEDFQRNFVVCTHLPLGDENGHPDPTNDHVYIEHMPEMTVYVSTFQGIANEEKWTYETRRLAETLRNAHNVRMDFYVTATYNSPFQIVSDRHEIWFVKFDPTHRLAIKNKTPELRYGSQKLEVPAMFSWALGLLLTYISILISVVKTSFNVSVFVKNNWYDIKERVVVVAKTLHDNISVGALSRSGVAIISSLWKLTTAVVTGDRAK